MGKLRGAASFIVQMVLILALVRLFGLLGFGVAMILWFGIRSAWKALTKPGAPADPTPTN